MAKQQTEGWLIVKFGNVAQEIKASTKCRLGQGIKEFSAGDILFVRRRAYWEISLYCQSCSADITVIVVFSKSCAQISTLPT